MEIIFFIFGWSGSDKFLAAVYSHQHMIFMRLHQHASSALISLLLITWSLIDLTWFIRSDDISLLWSDLVFYCSPSVGKYYWYDLLISCICTLDLDCGFVLFLRQICFDNFLVVFCKMDYEGHLLNVNKVFTNFFLGKKKQGNWTAPKLH